MGYRADLGENEFALAGTGIPVLLIQHKERHCAFIASGTSRGPATRHSNLPRTTQFNRYHAICLLKHRVVAVARRFSLFVRTALLITRRLALPINVPVDRKDRQPS